MGKCAWLTLSRKRLYWGIIAHTESQGFEQTPEHKCYTLVCVTDVIQLLQHRLTGNNISLPTFSQNSENSLLLTPSIKFRARFSVDDML